MPVALLLYSTHVLDAFRELSLFDASLDRLLERCSLASN